MKKHLLFFCFFSVLVATAFAYELFLRDGTIVKGTFISEDEEKIIMKAETGAFMNFKKENVDLEKTAAANKNEMSGARKETSKTRKVRTYTSEDLEELREKYDWGKSPEPVESEQENESMSPKSSALKFGDKTEKEWQSAVLASYKKVQEARSKHEKLDGECVALGPLGVTTMQEGPSTGPSTTPPQLRYQKQAEIEERRKIACKQAEEAQAGLTKAQSEYDTLIQQARDAGVPPGSINPELLVE